MSDPRIAIVGAGAVGTLLASSLVINRTPFYWVELSAERRNQLIQPTVLVGERVIDFPCSLITLLSKIAYLPHSLDLVIIAVKSFHVDEAVLELENRADQILVVANGLLQGAYNVGLLYGGGNVRESGSVHLMTENEIVFGPLPGAEVAGIDITGLMNAPWLSLSNEADIRVRMFHKLAMNCVINPLTAIMDRINGDIIIPETEPLIYELLAEISMVASHTLGTIWQYDAISLMSDCLDLIRRTAANSSSMREDLRLGHRTEISLMNLAVSELGAGLGLNCPCNRHMGNMICLLTNRQAL